MDLVVVLFPEFETLDAFGPVEIFGKLEEISKIYFVSMRGGPIFSSQQVPVATEDLHHFPLEPGYILLIPGGAGTRKEICNEEFLSEIRKLTIQAQFVLSVCTGSLLLAMTGLLDSKKATTNKRVYNWVIHQAQDVKWIKRARWVKDGNIYTSSGVSAGMDMALGFIADNFGIERAGNISKGIEYIWNSDCDDDIFSELYQ